MVIQINIKALIILLISSLGLSLGIFWFVISGSYFLLGLPLVLGILFGFILGKAANLEKETKKIYKNLNPELKNR